MSSTPRFSRTRPGKSRRQGPPRPPWGMSSSMVRPSSRRGGAHSKAAGEGGMFLEILDDKAITGYTMDTGRVGPYPPKMLTKRALYGITKEWVSGNVSTAEGRLKEKEGFRLRLEVLRRECRRRGEYAYALMRLGQKISLQGNAPVIVDMLLRKIATELLKANALDTRCATAFLCRMHQNAERVDGGKHSFARKLFEGLGAEGVGGCTAVVEAEAVEARGKPAFAAIVKRLRFDLESGEETLEEWAEKCCTILGIEASLLRGKA